LPGRLGSTASSTASPSPTLSSPSTTLGNSRKLKLKSEGDDVHTDDDVPNSDSLKNEMQDQFLFRKTMKRKVQPSYLEEETPLYIQFLSEAQTLAVESLVEAFHFLGGLLPSPHDYDVSGEKFRQLTVGCRVFVKSYVLGTVVEGIITNIHYSESAASSQQYESLRGDVGGEMGMVRFCFGIFCAFR